MQRQKNILGTTRGFTLVELLVVISIIAILAGVLLFTINPSEMLKKSRDARRLSEIVNVRDAINLAIAEGEFTLISVAKDSGTAVSTAATNGTYSPQKVDTNGWVPYTVPATKTGLGKYIAALPLDPVNSATYYYRFASTASAFELNTVLESADNTAKMTTDGGDSTSKYEIGTSLIIID